MSTLKRPTNSRQLTDETKIKYAIDFIEELSWVIESKRKLDFLELPKILRNRLLHSSPHESVGNYVSPNPNIHYLIGVLPRLFQDEKLFGRNEEIADFAKEVLGIDISRVEKRSKYELIGLIVCETNSLDDVKLEGMVSSLSNIAGNSDKLSLMAKEKTATGFSWNEAIRKLATQNDT